MKDNMYPKLEKSCLQVLSYGDNDLKKCNVGKSLILLLTNRDQSHQCRQRPAIKIKKKKINVIIDRGINRTLVNEFAKWSC